MLLSFVATIFYIDICTHFISIFVCHACVKNERIMPLFNWNISRGFVLPVLHSHFIHTIVVYNSNIFFHPSLTGIHSGRIFYSFFIQMLTFFMCYHPCKEEMFLCLFYAIEIHSEGSWMLSEDLEESWLSIECRRFIFIAEILNFYRFNPFLIAKCIFWGLDMQSLH